MKKFLALALVLGVVGLTNASIAGLQISVMGNQNPLDMDPQYQLRPSETLILDIWTDAVIGGDLEYYALVVLDAQGKISGGHVNPALNSYAGLSIYDNAVVDGGMPIPGGMDGVWGGVTVFAVESPIPAGTTLFDGIVFHCNGPDDAVIQLWKIGGVMWDLQDMLDQVVIDQIPEPITMLLLGLGGLFIRKR